MQRNMLALTVTCTLGGFGCLTENPNARPSETNYWSTLGDGETGDGEAGMDDSTNSGDGDGDGDGDPGDSSSGDSSSGDSDSGDGDPGDGDPGDGDPGDGDPGDGDPGDGDPGDGDSEECAFVSDSAAGSEGLADVIFIVDNSFGMMEETESVQAHMNGFSAQLEMSGVDYHVVLISAYSNKENGICIDSPLGSGNCPHDSDLPVYRHVDEKVSSHNSLAKLIASHQEWQGSIRSDSVKHIVVVSDDESDLGPNLFSNQFSALDPSYDPFVFHAIVCAWDCPESNDIGQTYIDLANQTGGVLGDLCEQDFQTVFDELADAVTQGDPLSCQFDIPPPPMGMSLDPDAVDVELDDGDGNLDDIPRVADLGDCANHPAGWYYDNPANPTQILLCPQTCAEAQGYAMGTINLEFGCLAGG